MENERAFFDWHRTIFVLFFIYTLFALFGKKKKEQFHFLALGFLSFMILLLNSITFWVGDQLAVPAMAVWAVLYPLFTVHLYRSILSHENAVLHKPFMAVKSFVTEKILKRKKV